MDGTRGTTEAATVGRDVRFRPAGELGRGGLGRVDLADDLRLHRQVAIKVLLQSEPDDIEEFIDEARITGQLEHPNIVPVHELGFDSGGKPYLVMKRVKGHTLGQIIRDRKQRGARSTLDDLLADRLIECFRKICDAVAYAHARGVIHRDLKPANVMVGEFGEVLVMDWGLAKPLDADVDAPAVRSQRREDAHGELTMQGSVLGTPAYMPPEQARGENDAVGPQSDVFSLGAILYHVLTHEAPYPGRKVDEVLELAASHRVVAPMKRSPSAGIPRELDAIVMKAMAADPADRYPTAGDLREDLDSLLANRPVTACTPRLHERLIKWCRRRPATALAIGMTLLFVALAGVGAAVAVARVADAEREQARLERESLEARERQREADRRAREASLEALAKEGRIRDLLAEFNTALAGERDARLQEFIDAWDAARARGDADESFVRKLGPDRIRETIASFEQLLAANKKFGDEVIPVTARDYQQLGVLYAIGAGNNQKALDCLNQAVELAPNDAEILSNRGLVYLRLGNLPLALEDLDRAVELMPGAASAWTNRGNVKRAMFDYPGAIEDYSRALELDPDNALALTNRGYLYYETGRPQPAQADAERALQLNDRSAEAHLVFALLALRNNRPEEAFESCNRAIAADPERATAYVYRSVVHRFRRDPQAAIADCNRALELDEKLWNAWFQRGVAHYALRDHKQAIADYTNAALLAPGNAEVFLQRGQARLDARDITGAWMDFDFAVQLNPGLWQGRYNQSIIRQGMGDTEGALRCLQEARKICSDPRQRGLIDNRIRQLGGTPGD